MNREESKAHWLYRAPPVVFAAYASFVAFSAYFFMYFYRKAFAAASFGAAPPIFGVDAKNAYVIAQVLGYAASKMLGIKVVSELSPNKRARSILFSIAFAELSLLLFAILPSRLGVIALAANGLSLGMIWGMVFGFLEGRRLSDFLGAGLCASFIVGSGAAKSFGKLLLNWGVSEAWMPALVGAIVSPAMIVFVALLANLPPPTERDRALRMERAPMDRAARQAFFKAHAKGLVPLIFAYVALTAFRDFRDNFAPEIWDKLGFGAQPAIMTTAEIPVAVGSLLGVAAIGFFRQNRAALFATHGLIAFGALMVGAATIGHRMGVVDPRVWMIAVGLGLYVAYVPYNCVLFDRMVAASGRTANAGFLIYVADASGYAGSVATTLYKSLGQRTLSWVVFLENFGLITSLTMLLGIGVATIAFRRLGRS